MVLGTVSVCWGIDIEINDEGVSILFLYTGVAIQQLPGEKYQPNKTNGNPGGMIIRTPMVMTMYM